MTSATASRPPAPPRRRRGLFDFGLLLCLGYGVYAQTPIGAVVETAVRVARGQKDHPSWFATFRGRDIAPASPSTATVDPGRLTGALPPRLRDAATAHAVSEDALAALVTARGRCDGAVCEVEAPDKLAMFAPGAAGTVDIDVIARGLSAAKADLRELDPSDELGIEALFLGAPAVRLAVEQAQRSSLEAPVDVEVHAPFLSPSARRGPLQGALATLLVHRLRTLAWPADARFRITSPFGERVHPVTGKQSFHNGTDIGTPTGTPLAAAHNASVKRQSVDSVSGTYVILDHGLGVQTTYCHLSAAHFDERARVKRGSVIGEAGATGRVTGPHLHYILRINDEAVDAERYGKAPRNVGALEGPPPSAPPAAPKKKTAPKEKTTSAPPPTGPATPAPASSPAPKTPPAHEMPPAAGPATPPAPAPQAPPAPEPQKAPPVPESPPAQPEPAKAPSTVAEPRVDSAQ